LVIFTTGANYSVSPSISIVEGQAWVLHGLVIKLIPLHGRPPSLGGTQILYKVDSPPSQILLHYDQF